MAAAAAAAVDPGVAQFWLRDESGHWEGASIPVPSSAEGGAATLRCGSAVPWYVPSVALVGSSGEPRPQASGITIGENLLPIGQETAAGVGLPRLAGLGRRWSVHAVREEPLKFLAQRLDMRPYEVAQLSVVVFIVAFCVALRMEVPSLLAAPVLALIPVCRICPELFLLLSPGYFRTASKRGTATRFALICLLALWLVYFVFMLLRGYWNSLAETGVESEVPLQSRPSWDWEEKVRAPEVPSTICQFMSGIDCSEELRSWAGNGTCAILAYTNGMCDDYCFQYNMSCLRARDDAGVGRCALADQPVAEDSCRQDWRTQVCVCQSPSQASEPISDVGLTEFGSASVLEGLLPPEGEQATLTVKPSKPAARTEHEHFDCEYSHWSRPWSAEKIQYCCETFGLGCDSVSLEDEAPTYQEQPREPSRECYHADLMRVPLDMPGQGRTTTDTLEGCQARCSRTNGCAHFTWWPVDGFCHLQEYRSKLQAAPGAITGPFSCVEFEDLFSGKPSQAAPTRPPAQNPPVQAPAKDTTPPETLLHELFEEPTKQHPPLPDQVKEDPQDYGAADDIVDTPPVGRRPILAEGSPFIVITIFCTLCIVAFAKSTS